MKVQLPFHNHAAGRSGGTIFQTYWGRTFARSMPVLFHYPDTKLQQEVSAKYFAIQNEFHAFYRDIAKLLPSAQRFNRNTYNLYFSALFRIAQTYPDQQAREIPKWFGTDKQQQVRLSFADVVCGIDFEVVKLSFSVQFRLWRRHFVPTSVLILFVNRTRQSILSASHSWHDGVFEFALPNSKGWQSTDIVRVYIALASPSLLSNFYRAK